MRRAILAAVGIMLFGACAEAAKAGTFHYGSFLPTAPHIGFTPHVGPVGIDIHEKSDAEAPAKHTDTLEQDADALLAEGRKARCDELHAAYTARHGVSTPRPLRGYHGCQKWAMDSGYWRARREHDPMGMVALLNPIADSIKTFNLSVHFALFGDK